MMTIQTKKPNILFIMTDQQSRHMMSCAGNPYVKTPAMDSMAESGTRFTRAYCTNPVCVPSRFSLFTGRMPSEIKLQNNGPVRAPEAIEGIKPTGLGWTLNNGGYDAVYAGKQHFPRMTAEDLGFDVLTHDERDELATLTADFVSQDHDKPWCLTASFINPHDICYMAIRDHAEGEVQQGIMSRSAVADAPGQHYNLETDPGETTNLYLEHPDKVDELRTLLQECRDIGRSRP